MTAPEDPFRSPRPGATPGGPAGTPGSGAPEHGGAPEPGGGPAPGGSPAPDGSSSYGAPAHGGPPSYGTPAHGGQPWGTPHQAPRNGLGIAALVLGVVALLTGLFVVGGLLGIAAIVLGALGRGRAKRGEATNGGMAVAGIVLGVLAVLLSALTIAGAVSLFGSEEFSNLTECLQSAGDDRAEQQECQTEFQDQVGG